MFSLIFIRKAAGLGTAAPISASTPDHGGKEALAADGYAHGPVTEGLNLHAGIGGLFHFGDGAFPGQYSAGGPQIFQQLYAMGIMKSHLGTCMNGQGREFLPADFQDSQILHQYGICPQRFQ